MRKNYTLYEEKKSIERKTAKRPKQRIKQKGFVKGQVRVIFDKD